MKKEKDIKKRSQLGARHFCVERFSTTVLHAWISGHGVLSLFFTLAVEKKSLYTVAV